MYFSGNSVWSIFSRLQFLPIGDNSRSGASAQTRNNISRLEARKHSSRSWRSREADRLWPLQRAHSRRHSNAHVLRYHRIHVSSIVWGNLSTASMIYKKKKKKISLCGNNNFEFLVEGRRKYWRGADTEKLSIGGLSALWCTTCSPGWWAKQQRKSLLHSFFLNLPIFFINSR